jgi:hypothetical protein
MKMFTGTKTPVSALRKVALQSTMIAGLGLVGSVQTAFAQQCDESLPVPNGCERANAGLTVPVPVGANTEVAQSAPAGSFDATGFSISIDNETIAGAPAPRVPSRTSDIAAARANVDIRYDGLDTRRMLNVSTADLRAAYRAGETVTFRSSMNYPAYVARTEVRVLDRSRRGNPVVATLPIAPNGQANWTMPSDGSGELAYVVRTFDAKGRFDETQPLALTRTEGAFETHAGAGAPFIAAGEGEDRTRLRNIPVSGGVITASGSGARPGGTVTVMGEPVPVDGSGRFVVSRIVPAGDQIVTVDVNGRTITRDVTIPKSEWFYVGIADATLSRRKDGATQETETFTDGRAALYAKGKTESGYTITTSIDTGEGPIDEIFDRLNDKDPRRVLDRLRSDDNDLYPTYGDDSVLYDDTPTQGRVYLRVENETTRFTWGNYKAGINNGGLLSNTRDLYGAEIRYQSPNVTTNGDARFNIQAYAASPETAVQRDILRGTGGSVYFLTRQDITGGSLNVAVQSIDPDTGRVVSSRTLVEGVDYRIDHIQGVLLLTEPLASNRADSGLVSQTGTGRYDQNLVVQYEFTPTAGTNDATAYGGRAEVWATDRLRFGVTAMTESTATDDQRMVSADVRYQLSENSYAELELARTDGPGISRSVSTDGGLTIASSGGVIGDRATALRFDSRFDLQDLGLTMPGFVGVYYEKKEAGFSTLTEDILSDQTLFGIEGNVQVSDRLAFGGYVESFERDSGDEKTSGEFNLTYSLNQDWDIGVGVAHLDQVVLGNPTRTGSRTDAALRLTYSGFEDVTVYAFGQGTVSRSGGLSRNNRFGVGFDAQLSEKLSASGEISDGDLGSAGAFQLNYAATADNELYLGYSLDPAQEDLSNDYAENGTIVMGGRYRMTEKLTSYTENKYDLPGQRQSLTNAYGINYTPTARWTLGSAIEKGRVRDRTSGDFDRTAVSVGASYADADRMTARLRLEYRTEDGVGTAQDRDTFGLSAGYSNKVNQDWRLLFNVDALISDSAEGDFRDGEYVKLSLGYAYRPIDNERLNMLFRYTYLSDLPGEDQVTANGSVDGPQQRSHVLSVNGSYDLNEALTLGAKVGYRKSEVAARGTGAFVDNTAMLAAIRLDWHIVHKWDIMAEGRLLRTKETGTDETGALIGVYRHIGNNAKLGIGYEWGNVSDDLTDLDYTNQGIFLNLVAKF